MDTTIDLSRWREKPRGVLYRISIISINGLRQELRTRLFRILLFSAWIWGVGIAALCLLFNQSFSTGGWVDSNSLHFGPRIQAMVTASKALVLLFPDLWIGGFFTLTFRAYSLVALLLSLIALTALVPRLVTRDRASNALTLYLSRPLTSADYLFGKCGVIVGMLMLLWTGPLLMGWVLSMAFAPDRDFIVYSLPPLGRAVAFHGVALVSLSCIALGVSASGRSSRNTTLLWLGLWLVLGAFGNAPKAPQWLRLTSFSHNLNEVRQGIFRTDAVFKAAADLPLLNADVAENLRKAAKRSEAPDAKAALLALAMMSLVSSVSFLRKLRSE